MDKKSIQLILFQKWCELINLIASRSVYADISISHITEITEEVINVLKNKYGVEGIILDVDETIRYDMKEIPEVNKKWIKMLNDNIKIIAVSNGKDRRVEEFFRSMGVHYISFASKPFKGSFIKACDYLGLSPENVCIIGDDLFSDVYGGKRNNMTTIHVKKKKLK